MERALKILAIASAFCVWSLPASAGIVLFSDLGTGSTLYDAVSLAPPNGIGWGLDGSAAPGASGISAITADLLTVAGIGSLPVTQIDLAVSNSNSSLNTFYASIWTDNSGVPGTEVPDAYWSLSTTNNGTCCSLVSVSDITGVYLTGGSQYFMVLGPLSLTDASANYLNYSYGGSAMGLVVGSTDGGSTWISDFIVPLGAFDVLSAPEPTTMELVALGLAGLVATRQAKARAGEIVHRDSAT